MDDNVNKAITLYCEEELKSFTESEIYKSIKELADEKHFYAVCDFKEIQDVKSKKVFVGISVLNSKNQIVEIFDDGFLTYSTELVNIDKKGRVSFSSWQVDDFTETLHWIKKHLEAL